MLTKLKKYIKNIISPDIKYNLYKTPYKLEKLGTEYGGWIIPVDILHEQSICYLGGAGEDISFDVALSKRFHCSVYIFDPTPRSKTHFDNVIEAANSGKKIFELNKIGYEVDQSISQHLHFSEIGIWEKKDVLKFFQPKDETHISHSITNLQETDHYIEVNVEKLDDIMRSNGHDHLDILKLDIEGAEFAVIDSILNSNIDIRVLCVEFHLQKENGLGLIQATIKKLEENNFAVIAREHYDFTFIKKKIVHGKGV
jgi:FkbM family methyltransferase